MIRPSSAPVNQRLVAFAFIAAAAVVLLPAVAHAAEPIYKLGVDSAVDDKISGAQAIVMKAVRIFCSGAAIFFFARMMIKKEFMPLVWALVGTVGAVMADKIVSALWVWGGN